MTSRLVLNLRTHDQSNGHSQVHPPAEIDMFFRVAYGRASNRDEPQSFIDTFLGNIGEPLRVDDGNDQSTANDDLDQNMELNDIPAAEESQGYRELGTWGNDGEEVILNSGFKPRIVMEPDDAIRSSELGNACNNVAGAMHSV